MFFVFGGLWTVLYVLGLVFEAANVIKESPLGFFVYLVVLSIIYGLSGINSIMEWNRRPVLLFGKYIKTAGPGLVWIEPLFHRTLDDVNVANMVSSLTVENVQTHDNVPLSIEAVLTMRVREDKVREYTVNLCDNDEAVEQRTQAAVAEVVGSGSINSILGEREKFSEKVEKALTAKVSQWGIEIIALEISNIEIKDEAIANSIAMKARAGKEAEAELLRADMQLQIAQKLSAAGKAYDADARWLKGIETLIELGRSGNNNTIMIPTDLASSLAGSSALAVATKVSQA